MIGLLKSALTILLPFYGIHKIYQKITKKRPVLFQAKNQKIIDKLEHTMEKIKHDARNQVSTIEVPEVKF
ncbi:MAG: hypothetical protein Salg2KO_23430 [Salibacteraceae bacterium]